MTTTTALAPENRKMTQGFLYIFVEADALGVITIGSTGRHPEDRVRELAEENPGTLPTLCYYAWSDDAVQDVIHLQQYLFDRRGSDDLRYEIPPRQAIRIIESRLRVKRMYLNESLVGNIESETHDYEDDIRLNDDADPQINPWLRDDTKPTKLRRRKKPDPKADTKNPSGTVRHAAASPATPANGANDSSLAARSKEPVPQEDVGAADTIVAADVSVAQSEDNPTRRPNAEKAANKPSLNADARPSAADQEPLSPELMPDKERVIQQAKSLSEHELVSVRNDDLSRRIDESIAFELHQERNRQREIRLHEEHQRRKFEETEAVRRQTSKRAAEQRALVLTQKRKRAAEASALEEHARQDDLERKQRALANRRRLENKIIRRRQLGATIRMVSLFLIVAALLGWFWGSHNSATTSGISSLLPSSQTARN